MVKVKAGGGGLTTCLRQVSRHLQNILIHERILKSQSVRNWSRGHIPESTHLRGKPIAFSEDSIQFGSQLSWGFVSDAHSLLVKWHRRFLGLLRHFDEVYAALWGF